MKKLLVFSCMLLLVLGANIDAFAQTKAQQEEISSDVPELQAFHTIIFPMWHKAYPAKDIEMLKSFVPKIKENMEKMNKAKLPGTLRDKEAQWKAELVKFNAVADTYYKACDDNNTEAILKAAENFHRAYEGMNRVVKPFVKEMDAYHLTLYSIYHNYLPAKDYKSIAAVMDKFIAQADAVVKTDQTRLEKRLKENVAKFNTVAKELYDNTVALKAALDQKDAKVKDAAIEKLHSTYKKMEAIFE